MVLKFLNTGIVIDRKSQQPFSCERLIIGDFENALNLLSEIIKEIYDSKTLKPRLTILIHPMEKVTSGEKSI